MHGISHVGVQAEGQANKSIVPVFELSISIATFEEVLCKKKTLEGRVMVLKEDDEW